MQILAIRKGFEALECKFEPFERISNRLNAKYNISKGIRRIQIQNRTLETRFEAFKRKFSPFERNLKQSVANSNHSKGIRSIQMQILFILIDSKYSNSNSNNSKGIQSILIQIQTLQITFEAFEYKLYPFKRNLKPSIANLNHSKGCEAFECKFEKFKRDSKHSM